MNKQSVIPPQEEGLQKDFIESKTLEGIEQAKKYFVEVKRRFLEVNKWHLYTGTGTATFELVDNNGVKLERKLQEGDYLKIDIPGPGTKAGEGFDWVIIEKIEDVTIADTERVAIMVKPSPNPLKQEEGIAHFFSENASSSFIAERVGQVVSVRIHGRNETPNTKVESTLDKARNVAVASGAILGIANIQWNKLAKSLIEI